MNMQHLLGKRFSNGSKIKCSNYMKLEFLPTKKDTILLNKFLESNAIRSSKLIWNFYTIWINIWIIMEDKEDELVLKWMNDHINEAPCFRPVMIHANIKDKIKNEVTVVKICIRLQAKKLIDEKTQTSRSSLSNFIT